MKSIAVFLVSLFVSSFAFAKKPQPTPTASVAAKATRIDRAEMFEGQVINAQAASLQIEQQKLQARIADFQTRVKAQYGVDFTAGDQVNFETGAITWHQIVVSDGAGTAKTTTTKNGTTVIQHNSNQRDTTTIGEVTVKP